MKTKGSNLSTESHDQDNYIPENRLAPCDKSNDSDNHITENTLKPGDHFEELDKENRKNERVLIHKDSGNVLGAFSDEEKINDSGSGCRHNTVPKYPLIRQSSNLTNDSGRSSVSELGENVLINAHDSDAHGDDSVNDLDSLRRCSLTVTDPSGRLTLPDPSDCVRPKVNSSSSSHSSDEQNHSEIVAQNDVNNHTKSSSNTRGLHLKYAPKNIYSHSEDSTVVNRHRRRSPYTSPTTSPRLRRQPTMETRRISLTDGAGGYTQLNQYHLKEEIGKVW